MAGGQQGAHGSPAPGGRPAARGFAWERRGEVMALRLAGWAVLGVEAWFTSRQGGVSSGEWSTLNLGGGVGDEPEKVAGNWDIVRAALGLPAREVRVSQVHGARVQIVDGAVAEGEAADALLTGQPNVPLALTFADCLPVYLMVPARAVGLVHAGWRGLAQGIVGEAVRRLCAAYGVRPGEVYAAVGPGIGPECYPVGEEVSRALSQGREHPVGGRPDLGALALEDLLAAGVQPERVSRAGYCTSCEEPWFFSHRRQKGRAGRMAALIWRVG